MPKIRPKAILARVILGEGWQERNNSDYLLLVYKRHERRLTVWDDDDDDDAISVISTSTTATVDNQPGTGRAIDTYIFQPMGRRIERLAMRFTIASLHPARIVQYIEAGGELLFPYYITPVTLHDAIAWLCSFRRNGSTIVAGMKGLVKQTQSNSIDRSASALAALIRVSLFEYYCTNIYVSISRIEPIFHLETLARSLPCSHPDKRWFLLLVKLGREAVIAANRPSDEKFFDPVLGKDIWQIRPSAKTAQILRQRLIHALKAYRSYGFDSPENSLGEACAICAEAISTCINEYARGDAYMHILETLYLAVIFVLRTIHDLVDFARVTANRQIYMDLQTLTCWVDAIVYRCLYYSGRRGMSDMDLLKNNIAYRSLALVNYRDDGTEHILLSESYKYAHTSRLDKTALPRTYREATDLYKEPLPIQNFFEKAKQRTRRLLSSFSELEREVWGGAPENNNFASQAKIHSDPLWNSHYDFGDVWWKHWESTLARARRVKVPKNCLTEEFREARRVGLQCDPADKEKWRHSLDWGNWPHYELCRLSRHKWGRYLRSNMDWDWDLGSCMKRLFKIEKQTRVGPSPDMQTPPASCPGIDVDAGTEGTLNISMGEAQGSLPREVNIAYKTRTGETHYLTFTQPCSLAHLSVPEAEPSTGNLLSSAGVKHDSSCRTGSRDVEQDVQNLKSGSSFSVASLFKEPEDTSAEESHNGYEGNGVGFSEVRVGGDAISICSLD